MQTADLVRLAVALVAGYFVGGIPWGVIVPRLAGGPDPRTIGSGRIGGANVSRAVGFRLAAVSGLLDVAKAALVVLLVIAIGGGPVAQITGALAAIVGHSRSPYIKLQGGRGVAPATGGVLVIEPVILAVIAPIFFLVIAITRVSSLGSLTATAVGGLVMVGMTALIPLQPIYFVYGVAAPGLIWYFHRDNIGRLLKGQERRVGNGRDRTGPPTGSDSRATERSTERSG